MLFSTKVLRRYFFVFSLVFLFSCSAHYYYKNKKYDIAIKKAARSLSFNPYRNKLIETLQKSYQEANSRDYERINELKISGQPEGWDEIFRIYSNMRDRQNIVRFLDNRVLNKMNFQIINFDEEIQTTRREAAEFFYQRGEKLLKEQQRHSAQQAYYDFLKAKSYSNIFKDVDDKILISEDKGTANILFEAINETNVHIPHSFFQEIYQMSFYDLNRLFLRFYPKKIQGIQYHYFVDLRIQNINISPEFLKENKFTETKEILEGYILKTDNEGRPIKDSLGNDIKIPNYRSISCDVYEVEQSKNISVSGELQIYNEMNELLEKDTLNVEWKFYNKYAYFKGDYKALSPETQKKIQGRFVPFPTDEEMILETSDLLKKASKDFIFKNLKIFK